MPFLDPIYHDYYIERCKREAWNIFKGTHFHNCYELYYMEEGEIVYFINDNSYTARKGDFILIPPGIVHKTLPYHSLAHTRILLYLNPEFLQSFLELDRKITACFSQTLITMGIRRIAERLLGELLEETEKESNPVMIRALIGELLVHLNRWTKQETAPPNKVSAAGGTNIEHRVTEVVKYIDAHYSDDITLSALAEKFYMNPTYLSRIFRRAVGRSYSEYLTHRRLQEAIYLLNNTDKRIMEIAQETGFHSDNHFCKTFKKILKTSPRKYRSSSKSG